MKASERSNEMGKPKTSSLSYWVLASSTTLLLWSIIAIRPLVDLGFIANSALFTFHAISVICLIGGMIAVLGHNQLLILSFVLYSFLHTLLMSALVIYILGIIRISPKSHSHCNAECFGHMLFFLRIHLMLGFTLSFLHSLFLYEFCYDEDACDLETRKSYFNSADLYIEELLPEYLPKENELPFCGDLP